MQSTDNQGTDNNVQPVEEGFRLIELNDLPQYSPWPARLMGIEAWENRTRNEQLVKTEYGQKWGTLYENYAAQRFQRLREALEYLFMTHFQPTILFHLKEKVYFTKNSVALWDYFYSILFNVLTPYLTDKDTLVELGCGWGRNLFYALDRKLCRKAVGGEYTEEGRKLGELISRQFELPFEILPFDYYKPDHVFMRQLRGAVVFSHNSIEQISTMPEETILSIIENKPKVVIHFEPIFEYRNQDTVLHCLWKRFTEINDYNRNLLTVLEKLEKKGMLKIILEDVHAFGLNAFNPGSFIVWQPTNGN
ncbi:hypothetical protein ACFL4N_00380 [Thermodesulfobacteriota bacterium]